MAEEEWPPTATLASRFIEELAALNEHDCLVLVDQDAVFQMPAHARESTTFSRLWPLRNMSSMCCYGKCGPRPARMLGSFVQGGGDVWVLVAPM